MTITSSISDIAVWGRMRSLPLGNQGKKGSGLEVYTSSRTRKINTSIHDQSALPVFLVAFVMTQHVKGIVTNMCIPVAASPQDLEL